MKKLLFILSLGFLSLNSFAQIDAVNDLMPTTNGFVGNTNVGNVLSNNGNGIDTLNGSPANLTNVTISVITPATSIGGAPVPFLTTTTGIVRVNPGTPAGNYTITYQLCEIANPTNCDTAVITIVVTAAVINAVNDNIASINGSFGSSNAGNVLSSNGNGSDTLNGSPVITSQVNLTVTLPATPLTPGAPVPSVNPTTGVITVPSGTPAGNYTISYQICEKLNPTNCDTAIVIISVSAAVINAVNDNIASINGSIGSSNAGNVLFSNGNGPDSLNGAPVTVNQVNLTVIIGATPLASGANVPSVNAITGVISIPATTPAGVYTITYQICEKLNPTNCDTAVVTINVFIQNLTLTKDGFYVDSSVPSGVSVGDTINYTFSITNNSSETLTNVTVTDPLAIVVGNPITLNAGQTNTTAYTATHTVTQADIDAGQVNNLATVTATPSTGPNITTTSTDPTPCTFCNFVPTCVNCTITPLNQNPLINVIMDGIFVDLNSNGYADVGETIIYTFGVANTGNVTLTNINVTSLNASVIGGPISVLQVGVNDSTTFSATHIITQADINAGQVDNLATVIATPPNGPPVTDSSSDPTPCAICTPLDPNCTTCTIVKLEIQPIHTISINASYSDYNSDGFTNVGDVINYQYTIANTNLINPITNITVSSSNVSVSGGTLASLAPSSSNNTTFTAVYVLTQADINSGFVTTTATANGFLLSNSVTASASNTVNLNLSNGIKLNAFFDTNGNGIQNVGELNVTTIQGNFYYQINTGVIHTLTSPNGMVTLYEGNPSSNYTIGFTINPSYTLQYTVSPSSYTNIFVPNGSGITTYNFPITQIPYTDLAVYLPAYGGPRPGFFYNNRITYKNIGNQTISAGTITFNVNNVVTISNYPSGAIPNATGFTFNFTNLLPNEIRYIYPAFQVPTIPTVSLGQLLTNSVSITIPAGDINTANNTATLTQDIRSSYDPNDKQESHGGRILHSAFSANDYLNYTIQFENTGNADAINVRVNDVLDAKLDEASIRMVDASHNYVLNRVGSTLNWKFDGINLPPSNGSATVGHGYITFQIKPKPGYAVGDMIPNFANIYFDFNPAIVTNTFTTEFVATLGNESFAFNNFNYFPNPVKNTLSISNDSTISKIEITSILGQTMLSKKVNELQTEIDLSSLSNGIYFVKATSEGQEKTVKIIKE